jgi:hypothetical protein
LILSLSIEILYYLKIYFVFMKKPTTIDNNIKISCVK